MNCAVGIIFNVSLAFFVTAGISAANAQSFAAKTHLIDVRAGGSSSDMARSLSRGSYELRGGERVTFSDWYSPKYKNVTGTWLTQVDENVGLIWGLGSGESGEKYAIDPSIVVGLVAQSQLGAQTQLTFNITTILGGYLSEKSCTADYGAIGGVQHVNCRLAASAMRPADTLNHLINAPPPNRTTVSIRFDHRF